MKRKVTGVKEDAERQRAALRETGEWLHDSVRYNHDHFLNEENKALADSLLSRLKIKGGYKPEQKQIDMAILLANLFNQTKKPVSVSLNESDWHTSRYRKASYFTVALIFLLNTLKYIRMEKGYNIAKDSRMARIWATERLLEEFPEYNLGVLYKPKELVILKDEKGRLKEYKDTIETWRIRDILKRVNTVNEQANIRYHNTKVNIYIRAIFHEKFTLYGRLHSRGYRHFQGVSSNDRAEITIDNTRTVELDFSGLHPNLLYAAEGRQYLGDPYSVVDERPEVRLFLKHILLFMLNAKDETAAERAANNWLYEHYTERKELSRIGITRARPLMNRFVEVHQVIAHNFYNGKETGLRTMNKDAKIALDIVNYFAKKNIPIMPIHDSFIVAEQHRDELLTVMKKTYHKHTGFRIAIK